MKQLVCGIFVHLEKALCIVNHQILCDKLSLRGGFNLLMKSYLNDRKQFVSINNFDSKTKTIT